jgi:hypothetical protein
MAWCLILKFPGGDTGKYDEVMQEMRMTDDPATWPKGCISHVAGEADGALCVVDVWNSTGDFEAFRNSRLQPAIDKRGGKDGSLSQPQATSFTVHNSYRRP